MELERVLTKLKFDESVIGYALITNDGQPFLSFSLPEEVLPLIQGTLRIHASTLKLVNIMTRAGIVILARIDQEWVLAVLFTTELQLGGALTRTKAVVDLLEQVELPPPPEPVEPEEAEATTTESAVDEVVQTEPAEPTATQVAPAPEPEERHEDIDPESIRHGCIVFRGTRYKEAVTLDSEINTSLKRAHSNIAVDVLIVVDEKKTVFKIAESIARPVERVLEIVRWCVAQKILTVECPEEQEPGQKEIVEMPLFEGDLNKAKREHRPILELCDGTRTLQDIAIELGIPYFKALQSIVSYRGKTLRFIRTDKKPKY
ncbi:MAG: hypothetical protein ACP6KW_01660 [Candidatus Thorarchaeota archaeon]